MLLRQLGCPPIQRSCRCHSHASASTSQPAVLTPRERKLAAKRLQRQRERQQRQVQQPQQLLQRVVATDEHAAEARPGRVTPLNTALGQLVQGRPSRGSKTAGVCEEASHLGLAELSKMAPAARTKHLNSLIPDELASLAKRCATQSRSWREPQLAAEAVQTAVRSLAGAAETLLPSFDQQQLADVAWSLSQLETRPRYSSFDNVDSSSSSSSSSSSRSSNSSATASSTTTTTSNTSCSSVLTLDISNPADNTHEPDAHGSNMAARCLGPLAGTFHTAMDVPFLVLPRALGLPLQLEQFVAEVDLARELIQLTPGSAPVPESRLTAWQCDSGAPFRYSGKEMMPPPGGMTPLVAQVRDALHELSGQLFDGVLVNYYEDGKCGMRFHSDPLDNGAWTPNTAVVSLGATRQFVFRGMPSSADAALRWHYQVCNGDAVLMWGNCQERLQHSIKVERAAGDAGPRMSLVFKQRARRRREA